MIYPGKSVVKCIVLNAPSDIRLLVANWTSLAVDEKDTTVWSMLLADRLLNCLSHSGNW